MRKRVSLILMCVSLVVVLSSCWNYRGLNTLDIVAGLAIDKDLESGLYKLVFEIIDTQQGGSEEEVATKYVESEGKTIFEAVRNAKKRLINRLYGGNLQTLIISRQIAETEGLGVVLEEILRDGESRETLSVTISQEKTAKELLLTEGLDSKIISYEIHDMVIEDNTLTASTKNMPLYKAYDAIKGTGAALVLPALHCTKNDEKTVAEANGIALFKGDKLIGFESADNTMYYLFLVNEVDGGALSVPFEGSDEYFSFEIKNASSKVAIAEKKGGFHVTADIKVKLNVTETKSHLDLSHTQGRKEMEDLTAKFLKEEIENYFRYVQTKVGSDIFGLGRKIYRSSPRVWNKVEKDWDLYFKEAKIAVTVQADIMTTGVLKDY